MDIFNRPPAISEDTLQYSIYPPTPFSDKASVTSFAACISAWVDVLLPDFLWHRDAFELKVASQSDSQEYFLEGRMRVGDCVDDEWCAVWLLKQVSSQWDMAISVFDSDGEFLLIEAADALPSWVTPANSENRVWIYSSQLHIIPLSHVSPPSRKHPRRKLPGKADSDDEGEDDQEYFLAIEDALKLLRDESVETVASTAVQNSVWGRINAYPTAARNHVHATKAYLPHDIARALASDPTLIQKPIETFYTRDVIQLRSVHRMARFPPEPAVLSTVRMTRTAYAQLLGQKFFPPKVFGQWKANEGSDEWRWRDVGMKIAVGFEMLFQESKGRIDPSSNSSDALHSSVQAQKDALRRNPQYIKYIQNLVSVDYFRGEVEGSQLWGELEDKAATTFLATLREDDATRPSFASLVTAAVSRAPEDATVPTAAYEDSDQWLNVDVKDFENMLETTMGPSKTQEDPMKVNLVDDETAEDRLASDQASRLQNLATKVEAFVEGEGDLEGARFEDEELSDDEEFSDDAMFDSDSDEEEESPAGRQAALDKLVPGLEPSEYGKMPASFHANSQKVTPTTIETDVVEEVENTSTKPAEFTEARTKPIRQPIIPRDKYDGVDSDDETDEEEGTDEEEDEDRPQVVGDIDVDMGEEEDEFLEFSRQALGITDDQWGEILRDRKSRGAFVPPGLTAPPVSTGAAPKKAAAPLKQENAPIREPLTQGRPPEAGPRPNVNPNLDSFEAVMLAMDEELARSRSGKSKTKPASTKVPPPPKQGKGKGKAPPIVEEEEDEDIDSAMDAELKAALEREDDGDEDENEEPMDYNLIKNFLESFKSQGGLSGPVSTLAGRLQPGWQLPRDES
ncbi:SGT1 protein-domain-containing protein [Mycena maculata]|uniref:SGT1 protein-domain-containing protein n=1 Tax=Mycena maculata TaxID=230809 RepID=A0AAD7JSM6_9AGAR|nr:SGT1 protein-domain-containing protein [Mycena maculata]